MFLQAVLSDAGPAANCFELVEAGRVLLITSAAVEAEVRDVVSRPKLRRKYPQLASPRVGEFLDLAFRQSLRVEEIPEVFSYPRDPQDEPYLNLAIAGVADYLVTRDLDLLDLRTPDADLGPELRRLAPQLTILDPVQFLQELR